MSTLEHVIRVSGASERQLWHWRTAGYLRPHGGGGTGNAYDWPASEVRAAVVMARLVEAGLTPAGAARAARDDCQELTDVLAELERRGLVHPVADDAVSSLPQTVGDDQTMTDDLDPDGPELDGHSLVMPFTVVRSVGGPYDDDAFVAGWAGGVIDQTLHTVAEIAAVRELMFTVRTDLVPQLELVGMRHQFPVMRSMVSEVPDWTYIIYARTEEVGGEGLDDDGK